MPLGHIQGGGRRLLATLDNLIDLTRIADRTLHIRRLDLVAMLHQAVEVARPLATAKRIALTLVTPEGNPPQAMADAWALRRIVDNLVSNAIKFTASGGSVEVATRITPDGITAIVKDTGEGMPIQVLEQIGEPFLQAESGELRGGMKV